MTDDPPRANTTHHPSSAPQRAQPTHPSPSLRLGYRPRAHAPAPTPMGPLPLPRTSAPYRR
jgi:hypothetical protein